MTPQWHVMKGRLAAGLQSLLSAARRFGIFLLASVVCAALAWGLTEGIGFLKNIENRSVDLRLVGFPEPIEDNKDIVVVAITEDTLSGFTYRSPVDRAFLANLLKLIESRGARSVYLDVLLDQPTEADKDDLLAKTLRELQVPLRVAYTHEDGVVNEAQLDYMRRYVPQDKWAAVNLSTDPLDGTVRWYFKGMAESAAGAPFHVSSVPHAIAMDQGLDVRLPASSQSDRIAWRPPRGEDDGAFPIFPAHALQVLPADWIRGKIVMVGAVLSITDRHRTPFALIDDGRLGMMSGVEIFAHQTAAVLEGRHVQEPTLQEAAQVILMAALVGGLLGLLGLNLGLTIAAALAISLGYWVGGIWGHAHGLPLIPLVASTLAFYGALFSTILLLGRQERERRKFVQAAFSRYVEPAVVNRLVAHPELLSLTGEKRALSFIFTDIAGFTTLSEQIPPEQLTGILNAYLEGMCKVVHRHEGIVDKFIGDAVMAFFNAPITQNDHADRAVLCGLEMDAFCEDFRVKIAQDLGLTLGMTRIGIHSGEAIVGNFGAANRMDFTALGDTVNAASRVEGVNKYFGTRVCATQGIVDAVGPERGFRFRPIGDVMLKGKDAALRLYEPVSEEAWQSERVQTYLAGFAAMAEGQSQANEIFLRLGTHYPDDPLVAFHCGRLARGECTTLIRMEEK